MGRLELWINDPDLHAKLDELLQLARRHDDLLGALRQQGEALAMSTQALQQRIDALVLEVQEIEDTGDAVEAAVAGVAALVQSLRDQLIAAGVSPAQLAILDDAAARLESAKSRIAEAVVTLPGEETGA